MTEAARQELEELGEETENVVHTTSKLQETIKECTAVAANGFKGFDILDDNGNYKSTYEIKVSPYRETYMLQINSIDNNYIGKNHREMAMPR